MLNQIELMKLIEKSMVASTNFYATSGDMNAATAIQDAYLCLKDKLEKEFTKNETT